MLQQETVKELKIGDHTFREYLHRDVIKARILELGKEIAIDYREKYPLFIVVLNGAFMFAADLLRASGMECQIHFIKLSSYVGTTSTGEVKEIIGLDRASLEGRHVVVVEDIVDTGKTMDQIIAQFNRMKPSSVQIATLLLKPDCLKYPVDPQYVGFEISDDFVIGYGLDLDGKARNLCDIYQLIK